MNIKHSICAVNTDPFHLVRLQVNLFTLYQYKIHTILFKSRLPIPQFYGLNVYTVE